MSETSPEARPEAGAQSQAQAQAQGPIPPGVTRPMFMVVAVLGIILVVGLLALIGAVVVRITKGTPKEAAGGEPLIAENLVLPKDGEIRRVWTDDDKLIVHTADPEGHGQIMVYDLRKGRVLARIGVQ